MNELAELQATDTDFEFYPTTNQIIGEFHSHVHKFEISSLLDIGAGNGKVLNRFKEINSQFEHGYRTEYFAIEKARVLLDSLPVEISILGTDFWEQSLLDKNIDCIFSNPPYKDFIEWSVKLIREANANFVYLVIPQRWKEQKVILDAIKARKADFEVVGEFDFLESEDRKARAKVDLVFIRLCRHNDRNYRRHSTGENAIVDPFELWVNDFFHLAENMDAEKLSDYDKDREKSASREQRIKTALVGGNGLIETLHTLYLNEMEKLINNYRKVCSLDAELFRELDISINSVVNTLKSRVKGLKDAYWQELFNNYAPLTSRLTAASRENFVRSIRSKTNIDFTPSNAYAITIWAVKNANAYFDNQMIETFNKMVEAGNVINYKSNERVFKHNRYRYFEDKPTNFKLDYRVVMERVGGIDTSKYSSQARNGLCNRAADFIDDLLVIAMNLGFDLLDGVRQHDFEPGTKETFFCRAKTGERIVMMEVRAFLNGNLHIKFSQKVILALNVEVGRLLGWIHNAQQAAEELQEDVNEVTNYFKTTYTLLPNVITRMLLAKASE